jgi:hypothetical protein
MDRLIDTHTPILALPFIVPSTSSPAWISLKNADRVTAVIHTSNAASGVTGSAITLRQATAVAGTSAKALAFTRYYAVQGTGVQSGALTETTATSNTFTPANTNSNRGLFVIDIDPATLDTNNGFDCFQVATADATAQGVTVSYIVHGSRYRTVPDGVYNAD